VTAINGMNVRSAPAMVAVTQDETPPSLHIDFPADGATLTTETATVAGRVADLLSGFMGLDVDVNGAPANVAIGIGTNGTFERSGIPLVIGSNVITAKATDAVGNSVTRSITLKRVAPTGARMVVLSGNLQTAPIHTVLPRPLTVKVSKADGSPFPNKSVAFRVKRSDGLLSNAPDVQGARFLQVNTDAIGQAKVYLQLGTDAGCGNNRVEVTSDGVSGTDFFCATATPGPTSQINIGSGNNQRAEVGGSAPEPLRVRVSDGCNGVSDVPVTFTVISGGGKVDRKNSTTVPTGPTGHAQVSFTLGPEQGNNFVEATFPDNPTSTAAFVIFGLLRDETKPTTISGIVLDNANQPIGGATCILEVPNFEGMQTRTDRNGQFSFEAPGPGASSLRVLGFTANHLGGEPGVDIPVGSFPSLPFDFVLVPHAANSLSAPVRLPPLDPKNARSYSRTRDTVLTVDGIDGLKMTVKPRSMKINGEPAQEGQFIALNQVHHDDVPMPMPDGAAPPFAWTLQPAGATFDPPVQIVYPNMSALAPGAVAYFLSFNHDTNRFEIVSSGHVTEDGASVVSDVGSGIAVAGWGCNCPPYSVTGKCCKDKPDANGCGAADSSVFTPEALNCFTIYGLLGRRKVCFTPACNNHDICWGTCGNSEGPCDTLFYGETSEICLKTFSSPLDVDYLIFCLNIAALYTTGIVAGGRVPFLNNYCKAQIDACSCEGQQPPERCRQGAAVGVGAGVPPLPFIDQDRDLLPDDWEKSVGLDPGNAEDAQEDPDGDGLVNLLEFIQGLDPFNSDTNGNGFGDLAETKQLQPAPQLTLDGSFMVSINGQSAEANSLGTFQIPNIASPDVFGLGGPGTSPDFVSDDFLRATGVSTSGKVTRYAFSDFFQIRQGQTFVLENLTVTETPPLTNHSIGARPKSFTLTQIDQTTQVQVTATLSNDSIRDVTPRSAWTVYRTSNPAILTVDKDGLATARGPGLARVTAVNEGATAVTRILVAPDATLTTVDGMVQLEDGTPVAGARIQIVGQPATTDSGLDGSFLLPGVVVTTPGKLLIVSAVLSRNGEVFAGAVANVEPIPSGLTHAGLITVVSTGGADQDGDGLPDSIEPALGLNPNSVDTDRDGIADGEEDFDNDGLSNFEEVAIRSNPMVADTDGDGLKDGDEFAYGADPLDYDTDDDGFNDGDEVADQSSPTDRRSLPQSLNVGIAVGQSFTVRNVTDPSKDVGIAIGPSFTLFNATDPSKTVGIAIGPAFTVNNTAQGGGGGQGAQKPDGR
jgi:hypothetical protein